MSRILFSPLSVVATCDGAGLAQVSVKVPGTFNGATDDKNGRLLKFVDIWADAPSDGDRVYDMCLSDDDSILVGIGLSGNFPDYPVLFWFQDQDITETASLKKGCVLNNTGFLHIEKIDQRDPFNFLPSGMYLKCKYFSAAVLPSGRKVRVNVGWGKTVP